MEITLWSKNSKRKSLGFIYKGWARIKWVRLKWTSSKQTLSRLIPRYLAVFKSARITLLTNVFEDNYSRLKAWRKEEACFLLNSQNLKYTFWTMSAVVEWDYLKIPFLLSWIRPFAHKVRPEKGQTVRFYGLAESLVLKYMVYSFLCGRILWWRPLFLMVGVTTTTIPPGPTTCLRLWHDAEQRLLWLHSTACIRKMRPLK